MPNTIFLESGLNFKFPADWKVFKYDEHRFYQYLSGAGLKGVDFIAIHQEQLILIEVKNYMERFVKKGEHPMNPLTENPEIYAEKYFRKFEDTFRLLDIIEQYYQRQWWYRKVFKTFRTYFSEKYLLNKETGFWSKAIELLDQPEKVKLVLWLELAPGYDPQKAAALNEYFQKNIQAKTPEGMTFYIAHSRDPFEGITIFNE